MRAVYFFLVPLLIFAVILKLPSGDMTIRNFEARLQYEPHFEYNGSYELPPVIIRFLHGSDAGVLDSPTDFTQGEAVQILLPLAHPRDEPIIDYATPGSEQSTDFSETAWHIIHTFVNVLTFDSSNAEDIQITGNAAVSFDIAEGLIGPNNFFRDSTGPSSQRDSLAALRSISTEYTPTGRYLITNDITAGGDFHKGSTFFINRRTDEPTFIGYDPSAPFTGDNEPPYIVISGLRVWTGPFVAHITSAPDANGIDNRNYTESGFDWDNHPVKGSSSVGFSTFDLVATFDSINSAYLMMLRVSDDTAKLDSHGNRDTNDDSFPIHFDAHPFKNKFYVGGPRVSIDEVVNYNLFEELSKPPGQTVDFPNVSIFLPSGAITVDGPREMAVSIDSVDLAPTVLNGHEDDHLYSTISNSTEIRLTLPGENANLFWGQNTSNVFAAAQSNRSAWSGGQSGRATQLMDSSGISLLQGGKVLRFRIRANQMFHRIRQGESMSDWDTLGSAISAPTSWWRDGPLTLANGAEDLWLTSNPKNNIRSNTVNGGTRGFLSEALTLGSLGVRDIVSLMNPSIAAENDLSSDADIDSRLYGQLGMQLFVNSPSSYYKAVADNFFIVGGGPVMTITADAGKNVGFQTGVLQLSEIKIAHDQDNWIGEQGVKLSFKSNSGLYFVANNTNTGFTGTEGPEQVTTTFGNETPRLSDVFYVDPVTTSMYPASPKSFRSVLIDVNSQGEADDILTISSGLLVTFDPVYMENSNIGWPLRFYQDQYQGTNGVDTSTSIAGNLMLLDRRYFDIEATLDPEGSTIVLANIVRADNGTIIPPDLSLRSARDRLGTTFDHITGSGADYQIDAISLDAVRIVFQNSFEKGDVFLHFPSQTNGRAGAATFDSSATLLNFAGSAGQQFNKIDVKYGTAGRYLRIRREIGEEIERGTDLVISGLRYYPNQEDVLQRMIVGYPDADNVQRLATVSDARVIGHQQVSVQLDRPVLVNPQVFVSLDAIWPFPDIRVSHDGRDVITGETREDEGMGDLRFALPGAGDNLQWHSDFSRVVYYFTTRDRSAGPLAGDFTYGTDNSFSTNNAAVIAAASTWLTAASADAANQVANFIDTDLLLGQQGGPGLGLNVIKDGKVLALDVVSPWPVGSSLEITGLLFTHISPQNTDSSHISNNIPTYAELSSGTTESNGVQVDTVLLDIEGGQFEVNPLFGHLSMNYLNNEQAQTFTQEPVYVSGTVFIGVSQSFTYSAPIPGVSTVLDNLNQLTVVAHEETNFEIEQLSDTEPEDTDEAPDAGSGGGGGLGDLLSLSGSGAEENLPSGFARGITSDGIRLTFPHDSPLRFLTIDDTCLIGETAIPVLYENIDRTFSPETQTAQFNEYGGFARTAYIRFVVKGNNPPFSTIDIFGFTKEKDFVVPAGTSFNVSGLSVVNVVPGTTGWTGYSPAQRTSHGEGEFDNMFFGSENRVPGLMLSMSSAGAVDAYLYEGVEEIVINSGSDTSDTQAEDTGESEGPDEVAGDLFNACLFDDQPRRSKVMSRR